MINLKLRLSIAVLVGLAASCSESTVEPPLAPSPLSTEKINSLTIGCPVEVRVQSLDGEPVVVSYPAIQTQAPPSQSVGGVLIAVRLTRLDRW